MLQKIRSREGATLLIALGFFLLCAIVGSIVLTAGSTASGRIAGLSEQEQSYYTVSSAARLVQDEIEGQKFCYETVDDRVASGSSISPTGGMGKVLSKLAEEWATCLDPGNPPRGMQNITLDSDASDFEDVVGVVKMDENFKVTVALKLANESSKDSYACTVVIPAVGQIKEPSSYEEIDEDGKVTTYNVVTTYVTWANGKVTKASVSN